MQVLLMSLKAGGVGINLTAASNAFVLVCTNYLNLLKLVSPCFGYNSGKHNYSFMFHSILVACCLGYVLIKL